MLCIHRIPFVQTLSLSLSLQNMSSTMRCVRELAESANLTSIPSSYAHSAQTNASEPGVSIPIVDLSLLASGDSEAIEDLDKACKDWGFFMVHIHHYYCLVMYINTFLFRDMVGFLAVPNVSLGCFCSESATLRCICYLSRL